MKQGKPKVSVIIPVYNTGTYVREAIQSISQQTLRELEIIVINDGSTDDSLTIIWELANQDNRIRVYDQKNQGQSVARNRGTSYAIGEYLYYMDSDDLLEVNALEYCYQKCEQKQLDFVLFDADILNKENALVIGLGYNRTLCANETQVYNGIELMQQQLNHHCYTPSPCLSFIRTTHFHRIGLKFYPGIIHEDQLFSALLYLQSERVMYISRPFFKRRFRKDSTMTCLFKWRNIEGYLTVAHELTHFVAQQNNPQMKTTTTLLLKQMLNAAVWQAHVLPLKERIRLLFVCLIHYRPPYISYRTLATLLLKSTLK